MSPAPSITSIPCPPGYPILALAIAAWVVAIAVGNAVWGLASLIAGVL